MRVEKANNDFAVYAVSGTHVVLIALNCGKDQLAGLRGFAFQRAINGGKDKWLTGLKVFKSLVPKPDKGHGYPTNEHPIQSFLWSDYATEPGTNYTFTISAMYGTPGNLTPKKVATFTIRTEDEIGDDGHGVWFNRGAIASQAFARKFKNKSLSEAEYNNEKNEEVKWLSRGLLEACLTYREGRRFAGLRL